MLGGPTMNLLLAIGLFALIMLVGVRPAEAHDTIDRGRAPARRSPPARRRRPPPAAPANASGRPRRRPRRGPGAGRHDRRPRHGTGSTSWDELTGRDPQRRRAGTHRRSGRTSRNGQPVTPTSVLPIGRQRPGLDADGNPTGIERHARVPRRQRHSGRSSGSRSPRCRGAHVGALTGAAAVGALVTMPARIPALCDRPCSPAHPATPTRPSSVVGVGRIGGESPDPRPHQRR